MPDGWGAQEGLLKEATCKQRFKHSSKKADRREEGLGRGKGSTQALKRRCQKCSVTEDRVSQAEGYLLGARVSQLAWARSSLQRGFINPSAKKSHFQF